MRVGLVRDHEEWNKFVEGNGGSVFTLWEWGSACELYDHQRLYIGVKKEGELVGGLPLVYMRSRLFGDKLVSMPFSERGSAVLADSEPETVKRLLLEKTKEIADEFNVDFVSLRGFDLGDSTFSKENRFVTFEIPLEGGSEAVWERLDSSRRGHVRSAQDNALEFEEGKTLADLKDYYDLYVDNMRSHGSPPHSFKFYRKLWEGLGSSRMKLYLAKKNGELVNGIIFYPFDDRVFHWGSVSNYERRDLDGGSLLLWKALEWSAENGYATYDLGRTREGSGVYMFKKSFGGRKVWLDDFHYYPNERVELPHPENEKYDTVKNIWRRLPLPVVRLLGPRVRKDISL
ncbi:lipid II:glycine glycyltransferase FemX [Haladaptatus salinisoli]|uniref:lipid II:glycine glycyltransferase FemX n=1 Tax=Haladaptatus salinisoli TaxID=2884876 RepID=UPI001D0B3372|nr:GNAT family N-acetyltransferase [Haladaptatus salinisoli]